jgi:hypothetical protein
MRDAQREARPWLIVGFAVGFLVLLSGFVVALSDTGLPVPGAIAVGALLICLVTIAGAGVVGYRDSRAGGRGIWQSIRAGFRDSCRTIFFLF